jgi:hypothetical protein
MLILVAMLSMAQAGTASEWPALVDRKGFRCLATAIARLPADRTIYVDVSKCPTARIQNAYPWVPAESDRNAPRRILRLSRTQSACLRNNRRSLDRIARPIGADFYLVDLAACRRP